LIIILLFPFIINYLSLIIKKKPHTEI